MVEGPPPPMPMPKYEAGSVDVLLAGFTVRVPDWAPDDTPEPRQLPEAVASLAEIVDEPPDCAVTCANVLPLTPAHELGVPPETTGPTVATELFDDVTLAHEVRS